MSKKKFSDAPMPSLEQMSQFEATGQGHDRQSHAVSRLPGGDWEAIQSLTVHVPRSLHIRFKLACLRRGRSMREEVVELIGRRTEQLEESDQ